MSSIWERKENTSNQMSSGKDAEMDAGNEPELTLHVENN